MCPQYPPKNARAHGAKITSNVEGGTSILAFGAWLRLSLLMDVCISVVVVPVEGAYSARASCTVKHPTLIDCSIIHLLQW